MFEKIKKKMVRQAKEEAVQEFRRSSNEGRIRTASAVLEGLLLIGFMIFSAKGGGSAAKTATTIVLKNCTFNIH